MAMHLPEKQDPSAETELVVVLTGAAGGIGRGVAEALLDAGHIGVALDVDAAGLARMQAQLGNRPGRLEIHALDVTDRHRVRQAFDDVVARYGRIDVLVNTAGANRPGAFPAAIEAGRDLLISLNIRAAYLCTTAAVPHMLKRKRGKVINTASSVGLRGHAGTVPRAAGKGGVIAFTEVLGRELGPHGVLVNAVVPSATMTEPILGRPPEPGEEPRALASVGRPAANPEVVATIMFLISPAGDSYWGRTLCPGGGDVML